MDRVEKRSMTNETYHIMQFGQIYANLVLLHLLLNWYV